MPVFLITPLADNATNVAEAVKANIKDEVDRFELQNPAGGWLVAFSGTTVHVASHLGIAGDGPDFVPKVGPALVTLVSSYYGRGSPVMWEWLELKFNRQN